MELVIGLSDAKHADIVTDQGTHEYVGIRHLQTSGTPPGRFKGATLSTNFSSWRQLNIEEANCYPSSFSINANMMSHQVFEFMIDEFRYLVPAILVIRALLKSKAFLMDAAFKPQGLEQAIIPIFSGGNLEACRMDTRITSALNADFLLWLYAYPSARSMFHSIFQYACHGVIGLNLPIGTVDVRTTYAAEHRLHKIRYVTGLSVCSLKTEEVPLSFFQPHSSEIRFHRGNGGSQVNNSDAIPLATNEVSTLRDEEWLEIAPLLAGGNSRHDPRQLLNGILQKLASGTPWRKCEYFTGTWSNASNLYQVLVKDGTWSQILAVLRKHRIYPGATP